MRDDEISIIDKLFKKNKSNYYFPRDDEISII